MTEQSESLGKLAEALSKAQGAMEPAARDHENPFFHSKYADLASVWESIRKPLSDNGLAVTQAVTTTEAGGIAIETRLLHISGEHIGSLMVVPTGKGDIQALGSAISYGRRYALSALVGVVSDEEDDGNAASGKTQPKAAPAPAPVRPVTAPAPVQPAKPAPASLPPMDDERPAVKPSPVSGPPQNVANHRNMRLAMLYQLATEHYGQAAVSTALRNHVLKTYPGVNGPQFLSDAQIEEQITEFGRRVDAKKQEVGA